MYTTSKDRTAAGFTLVEMLVVFVIIAILIGILVPVIAGAFRNAKQAAEVVEINSLVTALQQFKDRYGHYPPSQIILKEDGDYIVGAGPFLLPSASGQDTAVFVEDLSVQYLRYFWPELVINTRSSVAPANPVLPAEIGDINGDGSVTSADFYDWNGDNVLNGPWYLQGDECLVFFLGGIPSGQFVDSSGLPNRPSGVGFNPKTYPAGILGFSKISRWPMKQPIAGSAAAGRDGPFYEFDSSRLIDRDADGFWEFLPLRKPQQLGGYAYFSGYDGTGYRPDDLNFTSEFDSSSTIPSVGFVEFRVNWQVPSSYPPPYYGVEPVSPGSPQTSVQSPGPNPYTIGPPMIDTVKTPRYWKPEAFQIISPGADNYY
jgi:prepilin-type N-terminal cleavage/methylation domain-containing protein